MMGNGAVLSFSSKVRVFRAAVDPQTATDIGPFYFVAYRLANDCNTNCNTDRNTDCNTYEKVAKKGVL
jgi:hypothetical protein